MLVARGEAALKWLMILCNRTMMEEIILREWGQSIIVPIHKKRELTVCGNFCSISLLPHSYKVLAKVIQSELVKIKKFWMKNSQDQPFPLWQIVEKMWEVNKTYCVSVNFKLTFSSFKVNKDTGGDAGILWNQEKHYPTNNNVQQN